MSQIKLLLDSNAYLRTARSIHPLLFQTFGEKEYCLYVIDDFEKEFLRNPRLVNKFSWVTEYQYQENRKHHITISKQQKNEISLAFDYIWDEVRKTGVSKVDVQAVATAYVLGIQLISDDIGVQNAAQQYGVPCLSTIGLLHLMFRNQHITIEKVHETIQYLHYSNDTCAAYRKEYIKLFKEDYPVFFD